MAGTGVAAGGVYRGGEREPREPGKVGLGFWPVSKRKRDRKEGMVSSLSNSEKLVGSIAEAPVRRGCTREQLLGGVSALSLLEETILPIHL